MAEHLPLSVRVPIEADNPSICRKEELCIKCGQCREVCTNEIGVHSTYSFEQTEGKASVSTADSVQTSVLPQALPRSTNTRT